MFSCTPTVKFKDKQIELGVKVDYIDLSHQPNLNYDTNQNPLSLANDHLKILASLGSSLHKPKSLISNYLISNIKSWLENNPVLNRAWTKSKWIEFWQIQFKKITSQNGLNSENLLDDIIVHTRQTKPKWNLTSNEMPTYSSETPPQQQILEHIEFWHQCCHYLLLPTSLHTMITAPIFVDRELFKKDVQLALDQPPLHTLPTSQPFYPLANHSIW